jgi:hypothetical protein
MKTNQTKGMGKTKSNEHFDGSEAEVNQFDRASFESRRFSFAE